MTNPETSAEWWKALLTGNLRRMPVREARRMFALLSGQARCKFCNSPFDGRWASVMRLVGRGPSRLTSQFCHQCQVVATDHLGGAEIDLTVLFADVRGSTQLGERLSPVEFSQLISRFFAVSSQILLNTRAWVDKLVGDQVIGIYIPYFAGPQPERVALQAAQALLRATGHEEPGGPWIEVGVGIHSGTTFIGAVGSREGATDITVLGDVPNVGARLSSAARSGEILVSEAAQMKAQWPLTGETRLLELKGKSQPLTVHVLDQSTASRQP
jgi:adenylate cyclase